MAFTLTMPKLSPTMEGGTIVKWHKKEGDEVKEGDVLFEVATDKATVEYNAIDKGFLRKILVGEGSDAKLNQPVAIFTEKKDENIDSYVPEGEVPGIEEEEVAEEKPKEEKKKKPAMAKAGIAQPTFAPEAPLEGYEFEWKERAEERTLASPLARKLAKERNIDVGSVKGSGPSGRVMSRDLDLGVSKATVSFGPREIPTTPPGSYTEEPMSPIRKAIGERLQASKTFIPHFYVQQEVDAEEMIALREQLKAFELKITYNDMIMRATALALREHPEINSGFNSEKNQIIRFATIDIAVAVSIEEGLITPIIRHADYKNIGELSSEVKYLADLAKKGKLAPEQYRGGSFTISNLGMFGIRDFQAVINPPQAAILAVGGIQDRVVIKDGQMVPGKILQLSLSSDHRVVDGADAARFLNTLKKYLENPASLLV